MATNPLLHAKILKGRLHLSTFNNVGSEVAMETPLTVRPVKVNPTTQTLQGFEGEDRRKRRYALIGEANYYQIGNYHYSDEYELDTSNGSVGFYERDQSIVVYTPGVLGAGGFTINDVEFLIDVVEPGPVAPVILSPEGGSPTTIIQLGDLVTASDYLDPTWKTVHSSTRWQIATDLNFSNIVADHLEESASTSLQISQEFMDIYGLSSVTIYYIRVCYYGVAIT